MGDHAGNGDGGDNAAQARWLGVGRSADPDARGAGAEAAAAALTGAAPKLVIVFCSDAYELPELLAGIRARTGEVPLVGCSTAGEIATGGVGDHGVVVTVLGGPGFQVATRASFGGARRLRAAGANVAQAARAVAGCEHRVLLMLSDGLAPDDQQDLVRGAYGVLGAAVPLVGGLAGDDMKMVRTFQLHGDRVLSGAVVGAAIGSDAPIGIGVRHGWQRIGEPMVVTQSSGTRVYTLDDRPALDAYLDRLGAPPAARSEPAAFRQFALEHPLGLSRRRGEGHLCVVGSPDFLERSLGCTTQIPAGGLAWLMRSDGASALAATDAACADALAPLGGRAPVGMIAFDCIGRRDLVGAEIDRVAASAAGAPLAGFYTYGEIARTRGLAGVHNQTLVVLALG
jgi:hypothetical protein